MNFMKYKWLYLLISSLVIIPGLFSLIKWGFKPSIDFSGGTLWEIKFNDLSDKDKAASFFEDELKDKFVSLQTSGEKEFLIKSEEIKEEERQGLNEKIKENLGEFQEVRFETLGPSLGKELLRKTIIGIVLAAIGILIFISLRFKEKSYGVCAVLAMLHDSLVLLGIFSLLGHFFGIEVDSLFVTAVLTTLSFSVHDTVVVYDRIRELLKTETKASLETVANQALTETMTRSINNSMTIIFMLLGLVLLGGGTTRWFGVALLIGTVSGTYSSPFVAVPLVVVWNKIFKKKT